MSKTPIAVLRKRLEEAEQALHELNTGQKVRVFQDQNGERVEYTVANASRLESYIAQLRYQIDPSCGNFSIGITVT